jgi:hypothetical protein
MCTCPKIKRNTYGPSVILCCFDNYCIFTLSNLFCLQNSKQRGREASKQANGWMDGWIDWLIGWLITVITTNACSFIEISSYTKRAPTSFGQPFGHPMGDKILRLPTLKNIQCSRKEYIFIRCYFNNFIFIYCDCIRMHNFCMGTGRLTQRL